MGATGAAGVGDAALGLLGHWALLEPMAAILRPRTARTDKKRYGKSEVEAAKRVQFRGWAVGSLKNHEDGRRGIEREQPVVSSSDLTVA